MSQPERIYGYRELTRILTLTPRRAGQLRRLELLRGDSGYTFRDLLALRAASALLDAGASVRQIRAALTALRRQDPDLQQPLAEVRLVLEGDRLVAQSDRVRFDPRARQRVGRRPNAVGGGDRRLPPRGHDRSDVRRGLEQPRPLAASHGPLRRSRRGVRVGPRSRPPVL